jgi:uncharacterized protein (TIRG00374 family)
LKKFILVITKLSITALVFFYLSGRIDWTVVGQKLSSINISSIILVLIMITIINLLANLRWWLIATHTSSVKFSYWVLMRFFLAGLFINQALPSSVGGDGLRVWLLGKHGMKYGHAFTSILLDRIVTLLALIFMIIITQPLVFNITSGQAHMWVFWIILIIMLVGITLAAHFGGISKHKIKNTMALSAITAITDAKHFIFYNPKALITSAFITIASFFIMACIVYVFAVSISAKLAFWHCIILCQPVFLISTLPISISGWGVREGAMVVALGYISIPSEVAITLSIALGLAVIAGSIPGGLFLFSVKKQVSEK